MEAAAWATYTSKFHFARGLTCRTPVDAILLQCNTLWPHAGYHRVDQGGGGGGGRSTWIMIWWGGPVANTLKPLPISRGAFIILNICSTCSHVQGSQDCK